MSQNNSTTTGASGKEQTTGLLLAELQEKLARYDTLEHEISKLGQEQTTLENYVKNLMDSDIWNRNDPLKTLGDSDESDFQLTEDEEAPKKRTKITKSSKQTKTVKNDKAQSSGSGFGGQTDAQSFSSSDTESDKSANFMQGGDKSVKSVENDRDAKPENEPTLYIELTPSDSRDEHKPTDSLPNIAHETNGTEASSLSSVESDVYEEADSDDDSDFSGDGPFVVITKTARHTGKSAAAAAKATSKKILGSNVKAAAPVKTAKATPARTVKSPVKTVKATPVRTVKTASTPLPKPAVSTKPGRNAALGALLSSPTSPRPARPKLHSSGSSLSSLSSNGLSTHSPNGTKRKAPGASLKDLLKGSSVPRAGISRRTLLKKVA
ncbi:hypothetical protein GGH96_002986 [Coemansia sp. RSA 1972]|nr:hypothetical protein GGH96_002986 [Coemansia sp. RSA 1972]